MQPFIHSTRGGIVALALVVPCCAQPAEARDRKEVESGVRATYPSVLASWAAGDDETAIESLVALERELVAPDYETDQIEALWRAKLGVVRDLMAAVGDDVMVPVMLLHHDAYLEYRRLGEPILAQHSRVMAEELAMVYAGRQEESAARGVAASLLTSLGGHLQQGWSWKHSALLFSRATAIYAKSDAAHLGLGALYERRAELDLAVGHFQRAVDINPGNAEARLRLGVCLKRKGDAAGARRELAQLVAYDGQAWIDIIATEELAALMAAQGADPETVLREALERHPKSSRFAIQLARWLDATGRGPEAQGLLEDALLRREPEPESARYRYNRWPSTELDDVRVALREAAAGRRPLLTSAVQDLKVQGAP